MVDFQPSNGGFSVTGVTEEHETIADRSLFQKLVGRDMSKPGQTAPWWI
jgi:hypothetical protein